MITTPKEVRTARLSVKEIRAAEALRRAEEEAKFAAELPINLLKLLARAEAVNLDYCVFTNTDGVLSVSIRNKYGDSTVLNLESSYFSYRAIECDIELSEFDKAEEEELRKARNVALAKLTDADRKALGL